MFASSSFAFLLQAVGETVAEVDPVAGDELAVAAEQSTLLGLLLEVGPVGFTVFLILAAMSVLSWAVAWSKFRTFSQSQKLGEKFHSDFQRVDNLADTYQQSRKYKGTSLMAVFSAGYEEVARQVNTHGRITSSAAIERWLAIGSSRESTGLAKNLGLLSTTASSAPFIGLFGTVWGVLEAFRGLGQSSGATLRAVAPGIAEALLATALGLFAAIPALIFYNIFASKLRSLRKEMDDFGLEFINVAERDYGARRGAAN